MSQEFINPSDGVIRQYLATSKTLAVVGLSDREETTSNRVTKEMQARGYKIIPVIPRRQVAKSWVKRLMLASLKFLFL